MRATGKGFTLLELMVALLIATLMLTLLPFARDHILPSRRLALAAEQLQETLRFDRRQAEHERKVITLPVDLKQTVQLTSLDAGIQVQWTPAEGSSAAIQFFPDGSATPGRFILTLGQLQNSIQLHALTGRLEAIP